MPALENTGPPRSLKPFSSQGATALPPPLIQSFAALMRSPAGTTASTSFNALAFSRLTASPFSSSCMASCGGTIRGTRWVPPAPGNSPTLTSGNETGFRILGGDAVVARQRQFERAAEREAVDRGSPRLAAGLDGAEHQRGLAALVEQHLVGRDFALGLEQFGISAVQAFEHGQIGAGGERLLARGDDDALDGSVGGSLLHDLFQFGHRGFVEHVHRTPGNVPRHQRNAVGVGLNLEILEGHLFAPSMPTAERRGGCLYW